MSRIWTNRTVLTAAGNLTLGADCSPTGTCIVCRFNNIGLSVLWRSTDGGGTWTQVDLANNVFNGGYGYVVYNNGIWYVGSYPGSIFKSTDDGVTYTRITTGVGPSAGSGAAVTDGSHTFLQGENSSNEMTWSVDDGATFHNANTMPGDLYSVVGGGLIWNGSQYVALAIDSAFTKWSVFTAPGGFTAGAGPSWTQQAFTTVRHLGTSSNGGHALGFAAAFGYLSCYNVTGSGFWVFAATPAGLISNAPITNPLPTSASTAGMATVQKGIAFISNFAGEFAESPDGSAWAVEASNFQAVSNPPEYPAYVIYDPAHAVFILLGQKGNVSTASAASPGDPAVVPNVVGMTLSAANAALNANNCVLGILTTAPSQTVPAGSIISQAPVAGTVGVAFINVDLVQSTGPRTISINPTGITLPWGGTTDFTATTGNPSNASVVWSALYGTVGNGVYVAPFHPSTTTDTVKVALQDDPTVFATATVTLTRPVNPGPPLGPFGPLGLRGAFRSPRVFPPVMLAKAGTINPKIYMPQDNNTVKA